MKILITGSNWKIGVAAACSLAKKGFEVVGTDENQLPFNIHSRYLSAHYVHAQFTKDKFCDDLIEIIRKEKPDVLLPMGGTKKISFNKEMISKYVKVLVPDYESFLKAYDKKQTYNLCKEAGIAVPDRYTYDEAILILKNRENIKLVVKPDYDIGGAAGLSIVGSTEQLYKALKYFGSNSNYIIEEYIPGASAMRAVQVLFDKKNKMIEYFILKKIRQWPVTGGITAYAESSNEFELLEFIMPFFEKCRWSGPAEAELIIDERDGQPKLIEINPRFAGSIAFAIQCGINFPFTACMAAVDCGNFESASIYNPGTCYINFSYYLRAAAKDFLTEKHKSACLLKVLKELQQKKTGMLIDKKDFPVYLAKAVQELKQKYILETGPSK